MNAIPSFDASTFANASYGAANKVFGEAAENLQVLTDSLVTGIQGVERARAEALGVGVKVLQQQATGLAALARVTGPKEALELQQQLARQALDANTAAFQALSGLATAWSEAFKPLQQRYAEIALSASQR